MAEIVEFPDRIIKPSEFETWETLILSEQVPPERIAELLNNNPGFAQWFHARRPT